MGQPMRAGLPGSAVFFLGSDHVGSRPYVMRTRHPLVRPQISIRQPKLWAAGVTRMSGSSQEPQCDDSVALRGPPRSPCEQAVSRSPRAGGRRIGTVRTVDRCEKVHTENAEDHGEPRRFEIPNRRCLRIRVVAATAAPAHAVGSAPNIEGDDSVARRGPPRSPCEQAVLRSPRAGGRHIGTVRAVDRCERVHTENAEDHGEPPRSETSTRRCLRIQVVAAAAAPAHAVGSGPNIGGDDSVALRGPPRSPCEQAVSRSPRAGGRRIGTVRTVDRCEKVHTENAEDHGEPRRFEIPNRRCLRIRVVAATAAPAHAVGSAPNIEGDDSVARRGPPRSPCEQAVLRSPRAGGRHIGTVRAVDRCERVHTENAEDHEEPRRSETPNRRCLRIKAVPIPAAPTQAVGSGPSIGGHDSVALRGPPRSPCEPGGLATTPGRRKSHWNRPSG